VTPTPGERFGPYDILAPLGAGGMGVVFRARDTRLGREVALKTLPPESAADPARLQRFEQEARAASSLNHPNVLTVFDVGREGSTPFLVTELLEGETLRARLAAGPLPPEQVVALGAQAARGLAAVHEKGIVHRDLKPENLFVTRAGSLKILDFGVARTTEPAATGTLPLTQSGAVLGTAGYMSPEQVRGRPADPRSDLFALGAILHECLSGQPTFPGETPVERGYAILNAGPSPADPRAPSALLRVLRRCLEKAPEDRFQTARDLAFALETALPAEAPAAPAGASAPRASRPAWVTPLAAAWVVSLALAWGLARAPGVERQAAGAPGAGSPAATTTATPEPASPRTKRVSFRNGAIAQARFTQDGRGVVYAGAFEGGPPRVYAGVLDGPELRPASAPWSLLFDVSPRDELALGLVSLEPKPGPGLVLARGSLAGGAPRNLYEHVLFADFGGTDELLLVRCQDRVTTVELPPGTVLHSTTQQLGAARLSPDGRHVAIARYPVMGDDRGTVEILDRQGKTVATSTAAWTLEGLAWAPSGREVWFSAGYDDVQRQVHALALDGTQRLVFRGPGSVRVHDLDARGRALVTTGIVRARIFGKVAGDENERSLSWLDGSMPLALSNDGKAMLFLEGFGPAGAEVQTWLRRFDQADDTPVLLSLGWGRALSPDTKWALVSPTPPFHTLRVVPTGAGEQRDLPAGDFGAIVNAWFFADGQRIAFSAMGPDSRPRLFVQSVLPGAGEALGEQAPRQVSPEPLSLVTPPSPDGTKAVALDRDKVAVLVELATGATTPLKGLAPGEVPLQWQADGRGLWVGRRLEPRGTLGVELRRYELASGKLTPGLLLRPSDPVGMEHLKNALVTPDGRAWAYTVVQRLDELYLLEGAR
jgi:hypothetical protein